jgi:hypothetical protein
MKCTPWSHKTLSVTCGGVVSGSASHETKNAAVVEMKSALVLNATFEPLSIVSVRRATCLVLSDKAELIENDGTEMRSERFTLASPLVVRLKYMVKVPYSRHTAMSRRAIMARDGHACQYCCVDITEGV